VSMVSVMTNLLAGAGAISMLPVGSPTGRTVAVPAR
jgi:hypothetical protein